MASKMLFVFLCTSLPLSLFSLPTPEAEAEARAHGGLITLDTTYLLPLLLAGAAFAKGYLFGNLKSYNQAGYGGYGQRLANDYYAPSHQARRFSPAGDKIRDSFWNNSVINFQMENISTPAKLWITTPRTLIIRIIRSLSPSTTITTAIDILLFLLIKPIGNF